MNLMRHCAAALGVATVLSLVPNAGSAAPRPAPEAFAALPSFSDIALSTDGQKIAYSVPRQDGNLDVVIYDLTTRQFGSVGLQSNKVRGLQFEDGGQLLVTASATSDYFIEKVELYRVFAIDIVKKKSRLLLAEGGVMRAFNTGTNLESLLPDRPNSVVMSIFDAIDTNGSEPTLNLYQVSLDSNVIEVKSRGTPSTYSWLTDRDGNAIARADLRLASKTTTLWLRGEGNAWREALRMEDTSTRSLFLLGQTAAGNILFRRDRDSEFGELEAINPRTLQVSVILKADGVELSSAITDPFSGKLIGVEVGGLNPDVQWLKEELVAAQATIEGTFPGKIVSIRDFTPDYTKFIASVESSSEPPRFVLFDASKPSIAPIGPSMPSLANVAMGNVRATTFKSRDGVDIPVYVTTPPGHTGAKNAPTIIFPHGGPAARDEPRFDWWAQFMASRGYVVIQPQFRGSTGFGAAFAQAGMRQWGKRMQDDVSDAVAWAVKEGVTDAARTCIVGASYGGYAALAGATMTPELYICAISVAGVSDLAQSMREERDDAGGRRSSTVNYWYNHIGADDRAGMEATSPRRLAAQVRAPVLLIHGRDDTVVRFDQSRVMANALRAANKPFKLVELAGEDHWLSDAKTRLQMLREVDDFLAANLGPGLE
jgi:dipeptidyl aminopeptidase/acylaminoacyl peptidase